METELTGDELRTLKGALGALPYSGGVGPSISGIKNTADLVLWLEAFGGHLRRVSKANEVTETRLNELERDVKGMRRLFGVDEYEPHS